MKTKALISFSVTDKLVCTFVFTYANCWGSIQNLNVLILRSGARYLISYFQTRVLVTHGIGFLPQVDSIVVMVNGQISEVGSYKELLNHDGAFAQFLKNYLNEELQKENPDGRLLLLDILFVLCLTVLVNYFSFMLGQSFRFLCISQYYGL